MTTKEKFNQLKSRELSAKSNRELAQIQVEFDQLANEDPNGFETAFIESARQTLEEAKTLRIKEQMSEITQIVSMSYIAKTYFHKTRSWLSQRINELEVNGKPARFTPEEIDTLNAAFKDLSRKLGDLSLSL